MVLGPHQDRLTERGRRTLLDTEFTVSPRSDRTGLRLEGAPVERRGGEVDSSGCPPGAIQLPAGGQLIVLGPDRGTTGGYPVVATVISADLPRLGRLRPGQRVRFARVGIRAAERLRRESEQRFAALAQRVG